MNQNGFKKQFTVTALVSMILGLVFNFVGMVLCFLDEEPVLRKSSGHYVTVYGYKYWIEGDYYTTWVEHPVAGAIPLVALVVLIVAVVLFAVGIRKNKKLVVASVPLMFVSEALAGAAISLCFGELGQIGGYLCDASTAIVFVAAIMAILALKLYTPVAAPAAPVAGGYVAEQPAQEPQQDKYAKLKEAKELLDMGAITQEEFDEMKAKILEE